MRHLNDPLPGLRDRRRHRDGLRGAGRRRDAWAWLRGRVVTSLGVRGLRGAPRRTFFAGAPAARRVSERTEPLVGKNPVLEALRAGRRMSVVYLGESSVRDKAVAEILRLAESAGVAVRRATPVQLERLAMGTHHQGVIALAERRGYATLDHLLDRAREKKEDPFLILLDGVEDPHNLGAVLRVADGAGAHGVVIPGREAVGLTPGVYKASAGAAEHVPVCQVSSLATAIARLKEAQVWVGGAEASEGRSCFEEKLTGPLALVLGSEGAGLSHPVKKHLDFLVHVPMRGVVNSMNVSVATAILAFERVRQLKHGAPKREKKPRE